MLRALFFVPLTAAALRTIGFRRWSSFLGKFAPSENHIEVVTPESIKSARRTARMVEAAADEGIFHGKCLEKSIVLWWFLRRRQLPAELKIGGRRKGTEFDAHAWVELDGIPVSESDAAHQEYAPFGREPTSLGIEQR